LWKTLPYLPLPPLLFPSSHPFTLWFLSMPQRAQKGMWSTVSLPLPLIWSWHLAHGPTLPYSLSGTHTPCRTPPSLLSRLLPRWILRALWARLIYFIFI
jgi:hypothetical protein